MMNKSKVLLRSIYYKWHKINAYRTIFSNWLDIIYKIRKGDKNIGVVLKNGSKGMCNINCILTLITIISEFNFVEPMKFHFGDNNRLYYDGNLI